MCVGMSCGVDHVHVCEYVMWGGACACVWVCHVGWSILCGVEHVWACHVEWSMHVMWSGVCVWACHVGWSMCGGACVIVMVTQSSIILSGGNYFFIFIDA